MSKFKLYLRMLGYLKPYAPLMVISVAISLMTTVFEGTSIWVMSSLVNTLFNPLAGQDAIPAVMSFSFAKFNDFLKYVVYKFVTADTPLHTLTRVCVIFLVSYLMKNVFSYIRTILMTIINLRVVRDLRNQIYSHVLCLPVTYYDRNRSGNIISIILNDVGQVNSAMTNTLTKLISEPFRLIAFIAILFSINWKMTITVFIVYPFLGFIIVKIGQSVRRRSRRVLETISGLLSVLHETVNGIRAVKMFNMAESEANKFKKENQDYIEKSLRQTRTSEITSPLTEIFGLIVAVSLLWYGGSLVLTGKGMTAEDFIKFLTFLIFSYQPLKSLSGINNTIQSGFAAAERVFGILDTQTENISLIENKTVPAFTDSIEFKNVSFTYPGCVDEVLHDVSFCAKKGQIVALIGSSGSGKSTILDLVPRFYEIAQGSILLDGIDMRKCDLVGLRSLFGIVSQETFLFNDTVFNNIAYGVAGATEQKVIDIAHAANAWEFIVKLPQGLQTIIGEKGILLSGGQCQRLAIARALLRNPPILILDEATSALDTESERLVQTAINKLIENRTALVVAHRLSTIRNADCIVVLDNGKIVEAGTHDELILKPNGKYRYFHDIQFSSVQG